jgi:hypothetical protein
VALKPSKTELFFASGPSVLSVRGGARFQRPHRLAAESQPHVADSVYPFKVIQYAPAVDYGAIPTRSGPDPFLGRNIAKFLPRRCEYHHAALLDALAR